MMAVIALNAFAFAETPASKIAVVNQNNSVYKLIYEATTAGKVTLRNFMTRVGMSFFAETKKGLSKSLFSIELRAGLEQGEYSIEINDNTGSKPKSKPHSCRECSDTPAAKSVHITKLQDGPNI